MKEYNSIALILMLGGMAVLLYSLQSSLIGSGNGVSEWIQMGGASFGIFVIVIGGYILFRAKRKRK
jgi:uncharacterized membrane protein YbhN (UPF0104 family)